jgi:hypothetical protein
MTSDVIQILVNDAGVQAFPGIINSVNDKVKVYPFVAPEKEKEPFYTVRKIKTDTQNGFNCLGSTDWPLYEVRSWSKNQITTEQMHTIGRSALESDDMFMIDCIDGFDTESDMYCQIATYKRQESI